MTRIRHKFNAKPTVVNGRRYASKLEAKYAEFLAWRKKAGQIIDWLEQVPFALPGGITYRCDFQVFEADGRVVFVETKGMDTPQWKMKLKLLKEAYPWLDLEIVRKVPA